MICAIRLNQLNFLSWFLLFFALRLDSRECFKLTLQSISSQVSFPGRIMSSLLEVLDLPAALKKRTKAPRITGLSVYSMAGLYCTSTFLHWFEHYVLVFFFIIPWVFPFRRIV